MMTDSQQFETLYRRRLAKRWFHGRLKGPYRYARLKGAAVWWLPGKPFIEIETMVPDLGLIVPPSVALSDVLGYLDKQGIEHVQYAVTPARERRPLCKAVWYTDYPLDLILFDNEGDQMICKLRFSELV